MFDFLHIVFSAPDQSLLYSGNYDPELTSISVAIAVFASYAALLVSQHITTQQVPAIRRLWVLLGGLSLGTGIWAMHFVGMLAFNLPCTTNYSFFITGLSMLPAMMASTIAIQTISHPVLSTKQLLTGGLLIGSGIGTMHYAGMAAMHLDGLIRYDATLFFLSIIVAITLATLAIWIKFRLQAVQFRWKSCVTLISAMIMGIAVAGMHYTAMAAAYFTRGGGSNPTSTGISPTFLASIVLTATILIIVITIITTYLGKGDHQPHKQSKKIIGLLILGWLFIAWISADYYFIRLSDNVYRQGSDFAQRQANTVANNIDESLQLLKAIPLVVSLDEDTLRMLRRFKTTTVPELQSINITKQQWTEDSALIDLDKSLNNLSSNLRADAIWVVDAAGDCIASSNAGQPDSFVGSSYKDREYFLQARSGQRGHQYAVGRISKIPGLFYSNPVFEKNHFLGAVVVKRNITKFSNWTTQSNAFLTDANGVVVLAADPQFELRAMPDSSIDQLSTEMRLLQYKQHVIQPLKITPWGDTRFPSAVRIGESNLPTILASQSLPDHTITIYVPRPLDELNRFDTERNWLFILLAVAGSMLIVAVSAIVLYVRDSKKSEAEFRVAATAFEAREGMLISNAANAILRVNHAFTHITGYTTEDILGSNPKILGSGRHDANFFTQMWHRIQTTGAWEGEIWNRRKNGEEYPAHLTITTVKDNHQVITNFVATLNDITDSKAAADEIMHLAFYDALTNLPNRRLLLDRLKQAFASSSRTGRNGALLFIDLDNFKTLNDTLGHHIGDLLLKQVAQRLEFCVREGDTVARLGGDEFVVMLDNLSSNIHDAVAQTKIVGEKILADLNLPYQLNAHEYHNSPSIGATLFNNHGCSEEELMKQADIAMYQAKKAGRNTLRFFDPKMQDSITAHANLENELHIALFRHQFELYYQVQVNQAHLPLGAEALIRWNHPERGLIPPIEFIPLAEESGLIITIGQWVLDEACAQLKRWENNPKTCQLILAINVSAKQFNQTDFAFQVQATLAQHGISGTQLKLELTESILIDNIDGMIATLSALKEIGVRFSIDDFGTGYSSLQYLKRLPLNQLKIDQSFVRDLSINHGDQAIVRTIVAMAQSLDLDVIAEGVETEEQAAILQTCGCTQYQGYLFGKPVPIEQFEASLTNNS